MFGKKLVAEARIISDEGETAYADDDIHGFHWVHEKYIIEVRPEGEPPFRTEVKSRVAIFCKPDVGDVLRAHYDPKSHKAELDVDSDDRYNPKVQRANRKAREKAEKEALLSGAAPPSNQVIYTGEDEEDDDEWEPPVKCPECGARVDPDEDEVDQHHRCAFCHKPLPAA